MYFIKAIGVRVTKYCSFALSPYITPAPIGVSPDIHLPLCGGFIKGKQPSIFLSVVGSFGFDLVGSHPENGLTVVSPPEDGEVFYCCMTKHNWKVLLACFISEASFPFKSVHFIVRKLLVLT